MSRSTRSIARRYGLHHGDVATLALAQHATPLRAARLLALQRARTRPLAWVAQEVRDIIAATAATITPRADLTAALGHLTPTEQGIVLTCLNGEPV